MEKFLEYLGKHFYIYLFITIILVFALIGYLHEQRKIKKSFDSSKENTREEMQEAIVENKEENNNSNIESL